MSLPIQGVATQGHSAVPPVETDSKTQNASTRVRRRNRQINSCLECRRRKLKCDKGSPCSNCTKISRPCVFITSDLDVDAQKRLAEVKEKMGVLERSLEEDVARLGHSRAADNLENPKPSTIPGQDEGHSDKEDDEDVRDLDASSYATLDAAYYDDDDDGDNDDMVDLGIAMGKVRITERIGGLVRPRLSEELNQALQELPKSDHAKPNPISEQDPREWLAPSRNYLAPSSNFFFVPGVEKTSLMTYLPSKTMVDALMAHYWHAIHCVAKTVHRPSFERHLTKFWAAIKAGIEPRISFQAVVFGALLTSVISMPEHRVLAECGVDKHSLIDNFRQGAESALARANFLRTTKLETLQAFVMYLVALCRDEVSLAHSALTGTVIRLAECMGLHRDPTTYSNSPVEIHVRRLVWYQICFLDLRACEATGPRPQIRPADYDTQLPLNIDDVDLDRAEHGERGIDVWKDRNYFTDMTVTRMRFECYEMHRLLWNERPKMDQRRADGERKVTLMTLLSRIQSFTAAMEKTYLPMLNRTVPLHALASEIYGILSNRLYVQLLQRYLSSDRNKMPIRLRQLIMSTSVMIIEHSMVIETQPALASWKWYVGVFHQYHTALLLLNEMYSAPNEPEFEDRIWKSLDFVFDSPAGSSYVEKTRYVLEELVEKTRIYADMKRLRAPTNMPHAGPRTHTPGHQARQQEEKERSTSIHSRASGAGVPTFYPGHAIAPQHTSTSTQTSYPHQRPQAHGMSFSGAIPNVDWGTLDLSASTAPSQPLYTAAGSYSFNKYTPLISMVPTSAMVGVDERHGMDADSLSAASYGRGTNSSAVDAVNDIDWTEIEHMFGGTQTGSGMYIPPYSFPQFEPSDLNF